ncbi:MAG TPA: hypothetical protein VK186_20765 [Candidatus Deferrimicrobium sp.]|nr:hypothetical protein [Candidatus Deferrimicrobium sp.]
MTGKNSQTRLGKSTGYISFLIRFFWIFFAVALLIFFTIFISQRNVPIIIDAAFWLTVIVLVVIRYIDIKWLNKQTTNAEQATLKDWRKYSVRLLLASAGLYVLARLVPLLNSF